MTFQKQKLRQIEDQFSPAISPIILNHDQTFAAINSGERLRARQLVTLMAAIWRGLGNLPAKIVAWNRRQKAGQALHRMDAHMLADIGLTRGEIEGSVLRGRVTDSVDMQANLIYVPEAAPIDIPVRHKYAA
jgi:uncharacterized protein YjiS (DUF1127 family)